MIGIWKYAILDKALKSSPDLVVDQATAELLRVSPDQLSVVPHPGAEPGNFRQCTVGQIRVFCPMGVLDVFI